MSLPEENLDLQNYLNGIIVDAVDKLAVSESYELEMQDFRDIHRDIRKAWQKLDELGWDFEVMLKRSLKDGSEN